VEKNVTIKKIKKERNEKMNLTFYFNNDVNYLEGVFHEDLLTLFEQVTIRYQNDDFTVIQVGDLEISLHDSGLVAIDCKDVERVLPTIENALNKYVRLHEHDKRFKFPYVFKCFGKQKDVGTVIHALEQVGIQYETREVNDKIMFEIYQKATLY